MERTTNVSSRTPSATVIPICVSDEREDREHRERAGQDDSRRRDDATRHCETLQHRLLRGQRLRLGRTRAMEEDVVVDPQRDEEDEREERKARILAGEVGEELEDEKCEAERAEREHDRRHQHERPDDRTQEQHEDREDDEEHERDEEERVRAHCLAQVELGRRAADENGVAAGLAQLLPAA